MIILDLLLRKPSKPHNFLGNGERIDNIIFCKFQGSYHNSYAHTSNAQPGPDSKVHSPKGYSVFILLKAKIIVGKMVSKRISSYPFRFREASANLRGRIESEAAAKALLCKTVVLFAPSVEII